MLARRGRRSASSAAGLPRAIVARRVVVAAVGLLAPEQLLARARPRPLARIAAELPTVLEFLTLALSAGEGILDALRASPATGNGELARELGRVVAEVNTGRAARRMRCSRCAAAIDLPALTRTIDQLVGALERGTPLVEVLRAQAQDSRDDAKRAAARGGRPQGGRDARAAGVPDPAGDDRVRDLPGDPGAAAGVLMLELRPPKVQIWMVGQRHTSTTSSKPAGSVRAWLTRRTRPCGGQ